VCVESTCQSRGCKDDAAARGVLGCEQEDARAPQLLRRLPFSSAAYKVASYCLHVQISPVGTSQSILAKATRFS